MKSRPLPITDLANWCSLEQAARRQRLLEYKSGFPPLRYVPMRKHFGDIVGLSAGAFDGQRLTVERALELVSSDCWASKDDIERRSNLAVAEGLWQWANRSGVEGRLLPNETFPPRLIGGRHIKIWHSAVLKIDGRATVPFLDPRKSTTRLTNLGRRVAFSLMHFGVREPLAMDVRFCIMQFDDAKSGPREVRVFFDDSVQLLSGDELDQRIRETYAEWDLINAGREEDLRQYEDDGAEGENLPGLIRLWRKGA